MPQQDRHKTERKRIFCNTDKMTQSENNCAEYTVTEQAAIFGAQQAASYFLCLKQGMWC